MYSQPDLYRSSPQLMKFPKSFPTLIRKYVTRGFKIVANYVKTALLNHRPVYIVFHRGHLGTWRQSPPEPKAPDEAARGTWQRDAFLHVISLAKLHCRRVSSRGHMRISMDGDSERMEGHSLNTTTQKPPSKHGEAAAFIYNTHVYRLGKRLTWWSTLSFSKLFVLNTSILCQYICL